MRLHYQIRGNRQHPSLLFLHGFLGNHQMWLPLISSLQKQFCCLLVDLPGHGNSPIPGSFKEYSFPRLTDALVTLLHELQISSCSLVGYSLGGRLALHLALSHQHLIDTLILESSSPGLKTVEARKERLENDEGWAKKLETLPMPEFIEAWYNQGIFASLKQHPRFAELVQKRSLNNGPNLAKALRAMSVGRQKSLWGDLSKLQTPLLLMTGRQDHKYQKIFQQMQSLAPNAELQLVKNAGHNAHFEQPGEFTTRLHEFFNLKRSKNDLH